MRIITIEEDCELDLSLCDLYTEAAVSPRPPLTRAASIDSKMHKRSSAFNEVDASPRPPLLKAASNETRTTWHKRSPAYNATDFGLIMPKIFQEEYNVGIDSMKNKSFNA